MPAGFKKARFSNDQLKSDEWQLPPKSISFSVIRIGLFDWEKGPYDVIKQKRMVKFICNECDEDDPYTTEMLWPINTSNLKYHYNSTHAARVLELNSEAEAKVAAGEVKRRDTILACGLGRKLDFLSEPSTPEITNFFTARSTLSTSANGQRSIFNRPSKRPTCSSFDRGEFRNIVLEFILANNLPFALADSPTFRRLMSYLNDDYSTLITRSSIRTELDTLYGTACKALQKTLASHPGRFSLTIDEWNSGNNYDFLAVTLHYLDAGFRLVDVAIGFEVLNKNISYTGEALFESLSVVLNEYNIKNRIISITRDNAGPMNALLDIFATECNKNVGENELAFSGDIRCVGHVFNLVTDAFLSYTFFKTKKTKKFETILQKAQEDHPALCELLPKMRSLPGVIRSILNGIRHNHFLKNTFRKLVQEKSSSEEDCPRMKRNLRPETLLKDNETRWLSTLRMLERFIHFREQITKLLRLSENVKNSKRLKLEAYAIEDDEWEYLITIRDVLRIFEVPTKMLQGSSYVTLNHTIPVVSDILKKLEALKEGGIGKGNHLLQLGLESAFEKLSEYYPLHKDDIEPIKNLYLATVLDPRLKIAALKDCGISSSAITNIEEYFYEVYSAYKARFVTNTTGSELVGARRFGQSTLRLGAANNDLLLGSLLARRHQFESSSDEVKKYLAEDQQDTIFDFYTARRNTFPVIAQMARDFLAIPAMSASSERIFSKVGDMVTKKRNRLQPSTIKKLAILKARDLVVDEESTVYDVAEEAELESDKTVENEMQIEDDDLEAISFADSDTSEDDDEALVTVLQPDN